MKQDKRSILGMGIVGLAMAGGVVSASLWQPTDAANLALWLDAADAGSLNTIVQGADVTTWSDKSGHGNHATVTGTAPTYDTTFFGGMGSVRFDADPEAMRVSYTNAGGLFGNGDSTFVGVIRRDTGSSGSNDDWLWQINGNDRPRINWSSTGATITTNSQDFGAIGGSETRVNGAVSLDVARDAESILFIHSTGNWESRETGFLTIGNRAEPAVNGDRPFDGNIGELIFFNGAVSGDDQLRLEGYLAHKWGLEGALPNDHLYKASAPMTAIPEGSTGAMLLLGLLVLVRVRQYRGR